MARSAPKQTVAWKMPVARQTVLQPRAAVGRGDRTSGLCDRATRHVLCFRADQTQRRTWKSSVGRNSLCRSRSVPAPLPPGFSEHRSCSTPDAAEGLRHGSTERSPHGTREQAGPTSQRRFCGTKPNSGTLGKMDKKLTSPPGLEDRHQRRHRWPDERIVAERIDENYQPCVVPATP